MSDPLAPGPDETLDVLSNSLRILQRRKGHRATSDDVLLAGVAGSVALQNSQDSTFVRGFGLETPSFE